MNTKETLPRYCAISFNYFIHRHVIHPRYQRAFRCNSRSIRRMEIKERRIILPRVQNREKGGKATEGWLQKNRVELSISPEETSSHFNIVPFPPLVRQGLKSACYSDFYPPLALPILNGCYDISIASYEFPSSLANRSIPRFSTRTVYIYI